MRFSMNFSNTNATALQYTSRVMDASELQMRAVTTHKIYTDEEF